jgi:hypothetical protein
MCAQLLHMAEAAGLPHLTAEQLCTFRFVGLPESVTKRFGFSFPKWESLAVTDAPSMYSRMVTADFDTHSREFDSSDQKARVAKDDQSQREEVAEMASQGILVFRKAAIPISGRLLTFAQMDWTHCPSKPPMYAGALIYTAFDDPGLRGSIPSDSSPIWAEIALWNGSVPVTIDINPADKRFGDEMHLTLNVLWWRETGDKREERGLLGGGEHCVFGFKK